MIPIRLTLRNFMCYRQTTPTLDFTGVHVACLSGDNGNGKSALIDAMTWALWGKARDAGIGADDLMNTHAQEMEVEFEFMAGSEAYRVIRKRARPKRAGGAGQSVLELQVKSADGFRPIGGTLEQTQHKIIDEVLHMDYDTFINSAYLRQGHADEFTCQTPSRRKEVLANILGLAFYDGLESQAKQLQRQHEASRVQLEMVIREINAELARKPALEADLQKQDEELTRLTGVFTVQESAFTGLGQEKERLEQKQRELQDAQGRLKDIRGEIKLWDEQLAAQTARVREHESLIGDRPAIDEGCARLTDARRVNEQLFQDSRQIAALSQRRHQLEMAIAHAEQGLVRERALAQSRASDLDIRSRKLPPLRAEAEKTEASLTKQREEEASLRGRKEALESLVGQVSHLQSGKVHLEHQLLENTEKISLLSSEKETKCPLCERELQTGDRKLIESKFAAEREAGSRLLRETETGLAAARLRLDTLKKEVSRTEADLEQRKSALLNKKAVLERQVGECSEAEEELGRARKALTDVQAVLDSRAFATVEREALTALETDIARLGYSPDKHEQARQALAALEPFQSRKSKLEEAEKNIAAERENLERLAAAVLGSRRHLDTEQARIGELERDLVRLPEVRAHYADAENALHRLKQECEQARQGVWTLRQKLAHCQELEIRGREKETELAGAARLEGIWGELAKAFGRTGVQALLIEQALPEIEDEANRLLARMTDNRMHLKFDTQRENKKGNTVETLDINIADEMGTRPYEMFSGGEAFRIDFAIRIALSKVLARRAGAPLPTLIIDEGFGTQDANGIEKLKEAINSVQDDFQKILVITHIEELRDAFPTRIDVTKDAQGSTVSVS